MKTTINSSITSISESAKRIIYSFQVLMVGIAIPVLFIIGISNGNKKKMEENQVKEISNASTLSAKPLIGFYIPRIYNN